MSNSSLFPRLGRNQGKIIDNEFPDTGRIALAYLILDLHEKNFLADKSEIVRELERLGRLSINDEDISTGKEFVIVVSKLINQLEWYQVYSFCERIYSKLLRETGNEYDGCYINLFEVRSYFSKEINLVMEEENLGFTLIDGQFFRRGKAQTQKAFERVGSVLSDPRLEVVKFHYYKAKKFFDERPMPDLSNCIKEALCSLEACIDILTMKSASKDFEKAIRQLQGSGSRQIPSPIGEAMIKLHGYRGSGKGVSHAALQGNKVEIEEVELVLSLVASYITYLVQIFSETEEIPF